jgi:hypothetical protein
MRLRRPVEKDFRGCADSNGCISNVKTRIFFFRFLSAAG